MTFATLNDTGVLAVAQFVQRNALERCNGGKHINAWFSAAENAANNASDGESIVLEIGRQYSKSGHPETITLQRVYFDFAEVA